MKVFLFLDFDGTLAPIADTPGQAVLPAPAKQALRRLSRHPRFNVAIISGRTLNDLRRKTGIAGIMYAGNHGLEIAGKGIALPVSVDRRTKRLMRKIHAQLEDAFSDVPGVLVEDKDITVSFHYRLVARRAALKVKRRFAGIMRPYVRKREVAVHAGKMVLEVKPPVRWDKGKTVLHILDACRDKNVLPVFIGDDITDESAFRALRGRGITIHVGGSRKTAAAYRLNDTAAVRQFLEALEKL